MGVDLIGLTSGAAGDESADKGGDARPPIVFLEQGDGAEEAAVSAGEGFVDAFNKEMAGGFGDVEAALVVEGALVKVPVFRGRVW